LWFDAAKRRLDHLREGREDRILQLRDHQPDQTGGPSLPAPVSMTVYAVQRMVGGLTIGLIELLR
jgi:hypothetical protein